MPADLLHLVIVAGHAVMHRFADPTDERNWTLLDFQRNEVPCYIGHTRAGIEAAARDDSALLVFAGGQSRLEAGPVSEATTYYWIALWHGWFGRPEVAARTITEEFSRDSFENLLFSLCRFREFTGRFPAHVTLVSWGFKKERFGLHRAAIGWPAHRFTYLGANNPPDLGQALAAETRARDKYRADPYSSGEEFSAKRAARNPFRRFHGYLITSPELAPLLAHRGPEPYAGPLPW